MAAPFLEVVDLHKRYGGTAALAGVSFEVQTGELFGLLGPNGAGKTTLLSIISGLLSPDGGSVRIRGEPVRQADKGFRQQVGIVPQEIALYGELSAAENLRFFGRLYGLGGSRLEKRVEEVVTAVGLSDRADSRVATFSGGMKRRLNLGVALMHRPPLLLLDEPTIGVDPQSRNYMFEEIRRLNQDGITIVYTSHYMEEVQALCSRVGILERGKLIACDLVPTLLKQLSGLIRFRVPETMPGLTERLKDMDGVSLAGSNDGVVALECRDVKTTLLRLAGVLNELHLELTSLEIQEPNLERVFLHLTGRALRD